MSRKEILKDTTTNSVTTISKPMNKITKWSLLRINYRDICHFDQLPTRPHKMKNSFLLFFSFLYFLFCSSLKTSSFSSCLFFPEVFIRERHQMVLPFSPLHDRIGEWSWAKTSQNFWTAVRPNIKSCVVTRICLTFY